MKPQGTKNYCGDQRKERVQESDLTKMFMNSSDYYLFEAVTNQKLSILCLKKH